MALFAVNKPLNQALKFFKSKSKDPNNHFCLPSCDDSFECSYYSLDVAYTVLVTWKKLNLVKRLNEEKFSEVNLMNLF